MINSYQQFLKCHSLGNDFILFDWSNLAYQKTEDVIKHPDWPRKIKEICRRNYSIGADGVLIIRKINEGPLEILLFNQDGSRAEKCLNGLRCVTYYLTEQKKHKGTMLLSMGQEIHPCKVDTDGSEIIIKNSHYKKPLEITLRDKKFLGHVVEIGNPHFVIFDTVELEWLRENGNFFEQHSAFPNRTNVEFVIRHEIDETKPTTFEVLIYERGCGITLASGSGAAAVAKVLSQLGLIEIGQEFIIKMPGGSIKTTISINQEIIQKAKATIVFSGNLNQTVIPAHAGIQT
ncbi:MAG: diaminopimelate epimerase [Pseudomonadota bacterium]